MRTITINKAMNGYIVQVGCQTLVFETAANFLYELTKYLKDPQGVEAFYLDMYAPEKADEPFPTARDAGQCDTAPSNQRTDQYSGEGSANTYATPLVRDRG